MLREHYWWCGFWYSVLNRLFGFCWTRCTYTTALSPSQLTWNNFKKVTSRLVLIGRQLIDPTALERNTTLFKKDKERDRVTDRHEENTRIKGIHRPNSKSISGSGPGCGAHANTDAVWARSVLGCRPAEGGINDGGSSDSGKCRFIPEKLPAYILNPSSTKVRGHPLLVTNWAATAVTTSPASEQQEAC